MILCIINIFKLLLKSTGFMLGREQLIIPFFFKMADFWNQRDSLVVKIFILPEDSAPTSHG